MLETFTADTFANRIGETFRLYTNGAAADAVLTEVTRLGSSATGASVSGGKGGRAQAFSIVFRAPRGAHAAQGIYRMEHPAIGEFELFLVPVGLDGAGMRYEAVFT